MDNLTARRVEGHVLDEQADADRNGQKRRSFTEAVAMFAPIVPLPGDAPRVSVDVAPDALDDDLPPATGPQPIPLSLRLRAAVLPNDALPATVRTAPEEPDDDLPPAQGLQPIAIPPRPLAPPSSLRQTVQEPEAERIAEFPARPEPMDDAAFRRSIAPPSLSDMPGQAAAVVASCTRPRRRRAWPWAALLVLSVAGAAVPWMQRAPEPPLAEPQSVGPTTEFAAPAPAGIASSLDVAPTPPPPADVAAEPVLPFAPQALSEPAPEPIPAPPADIATEPVLPFVHQTASEPMPEPAPEPAPEVAPAPGSPGAPNLVAPELDAVATEPPPPPPSPAPGTEADTASLPLPLPIPPVPVLPTPTLTSPNRRVVIYHRPASSAAAAEAARLAAKLRPLAAQVETRMAAAIFRLPTLRYFHAEDADAAQKLAVALRRSDAEWRVQGMLAQDPLPPLHSFQVWLPAQRPS